MERAQREIAEEIEGIIHRFWKDSPENALTEDSDERAWEAPLVGFSRGDDPLYVKLKERIGPFYWTPEEIFNATFPDRPARAGELSVVCWVLPQTEATRADQGRQTKVPAGRWARSRWFGEKFNCALRLHLAGALTAMGHPAVAPERTAGFDYRRSERFGIASNWSERHAAFISGLGTFGLSDGLITPRGKAVRIGSVVARIDLPPTERPYGDDHQAWCLWYAKGTCGACAPRCPAGAITPEGGHDKDACQRYIREVTTPYATEHFGTGATPCGLCQVRIPCEARIPAGITPPAR